MVIMVTSVNCLWSHVDLCNFYIHLRSLNVNNFGMFETTELQHRGHLQSHDVPAEFYENLSGGYTDRHGDIISLTFRFEKSRPKGPRCSSVAPNNTTLLQCTCMFHAQLHDVTSLLEVTQFFFVFN
jgi:hypothetical protein